MVLIDDEMVCIPSHQVIENIYKNEQDELNSFEVSDEVANALREALQNK